MQFKVPTMDSSKAANELKETILTSEPNAKIEVDLDSKMVTINSEASEETFKELIVATGHKIN